MIATSEDLLVRNEDDFWRLPDGLWEVVAGRAVFLPPKENEHAYISGELILLLGQQVDFKDAAMSFRRRTSAFPAGRSLPASSGVAFRI